MQELEKCVQKNIEQYTMIQPGDTVICGLSGGPDSVCMLHILHLLKGTLGFELVAVHINHMIRGVKADEDMKFSESFAKQLGVPFFSKTVDVPRLAKKWRMSEEETGRKVRYEAFRQIGESKAPYKIAVAHNSNDVAETFLFNLARGAGLEGLCSIKRVNGDIIRPLLDVYKDEIIAYLKENNLAYRIDDTNNQCDYTRNRIRNILIGSINQALNTDIVRKISQTTSLLEDDWSFLKESGVNAYGICNKEYEGKRIIDCTLFNEYHIAVKRQVIRLYLTDQIGSLDGYGSFHINQLIALAEKDVPSSLELPKKFIAAFRYGRLSVERDEGKKDDVSSIRQTLCVPGETFVESAGWKLVCEIVPYSKDIDFRRSVSDHVQYFDVDETGMDLTVRNRKPGDIFKPFGMKGTKKLKDYLIDKKTEKEKRDQIPLIEGPTGILWVIGYGRSDEARITNQTRKILKLSFFKTKGEFVNVQ